MVVSSTKTLIDGGFAAATTISFAFGPVGAAVAGVLAAGKFLFDIFYSDPVPAQDPRTKLPDITDMKTALDDLQNKLSAVLWADFQQNYKAGVDTMSSAILAAQSHLGAKSKTTHLIAGNTIVWVNGTNVSLFDPVFANPSPLQQAMNWIEGAGDYAFRSIGLYTFTVGVYQIYCKTGLVWEVNQNIGDYQSRLQTYNDAMANWATLNATYQAQHPGTTASLPKPALDLPEAPTGGDFAVGAEVIDPVSHVLTYRSQLGKSLSAFAVALRDDLPGRIKYLNSVLAKYAAAAVTRQAAVDARLAQLSVVAGSTPGSWHWVDAQTGDRGDDVGSQMLANSQLKMAVGKLRTPIWNTQTSALFLADLDASDIQTLTDTRDLWVATLKMYTDALNNGEDLSQGATS